MIHHRHHRHHRPTPLPLRAVGALVLALLVPIAGCSDGGDGRAGAGAPRRDPESTTTRTATTDAPPSTGAPATDAPGLTVFTAQARDAVNELKAAWEGGDQARARAVAPGDVVDALFAVPAGGFQVYGCDTGEFDTSTCNLRNRSTGVFITVTAARQPQGWQIATVFVDQG